MKHVFLKLVVLATCVFATQSIMAESKFTNPLTISLGKVSTFKLVAADYTTHPLAQDTVLQLQPIALLVNANVVTADVSPEALQKVKSRLVEMNIKDVYGRIQKQDFVNTDSLFEELEYSQAFNETLMTILGTGRAGHYTWYSGFLNTDTCISGKIQFNVKQRTDISGSSEGSRDLFNTKPLTLNYKIGSGFPYDVKKFQGTAHFTVLDPDSIEVGKYDIKMNASNDSVLLEYIQEGMICEIDSAKEGRYAVVLTADWLTGSQTYFLDVTDPLKEASSSKVVDATYRLKDSKFDEKTRSAWNYSGSLTPEYAVEKNSSAMVVKKMGTSDDESFSISQKIYSMPQGWYQLKWNAFYQPCNIKQMRISYPVMASITANTESMPMAHVFDGPSVSEDGDYSTVSIPANASGAQNVFGAHKYENTLNFCVGQDSIVVLGANAKASELNGVLTAIGRPMLFFHGKGLAFGQISRAQADSVFAAGDSVKYNVTLIDGIGKKVPEDNIIRFVVCKGMELKTDSILLADSLKAGQAGDYVVGFQIPEADKYYNGVYSVFIVSIHEDGEYQAKMNDKIFLKDGKTPTKVTSVVQEKKSSNYTYDLNGRRINKLSSHKGVYIRNGKKIVK